MEKTKEVVINSCYGGFDLSNEAVDELFFLKTGKHLVWYIAEDLSLSSTRYLRLGDFSNISDENKTELFKVIPFSKDEGESFSSDDKDNDIVMYTEIARDDKDLVAVVKKLKEKSCRRLSDGHFLSRLDVVKIPSDAKFVISDYDGVETLYWSLTEIFRA